MSNKNDALDLCRRGWRIFPLHTPNGKECSCNKPGCESIGKHPRIMEWQKNASNDIEKVSTWWDMYPAANIGLATGEIIVVDVDDKELAIEYIQKLEDCKTVSVETGKGYHYYFKAPDFHLGNRAKFLPGIDLRGEGGYVVAPPSIHYSGHTYCWKNNPDEYSLQGLPPFILSALSERIQKEATTAEGEKIMQGGRDNALASLGGTLRKTGCGYETVYAALYARNQEACIPPLDEPDVERIAKSVCRYATGDELNQELINEGAAIWEGMRKNNEQKNIFPLTLYSDLGVTKPQWIIKGFLEDKSLGLIFGSSGSGKSYLAIDLAACIVSGKPFCDHQIKKQGPVVYIAGEGFSGISRRLRAWEIKHALSLKECPILISHKPCALGDPELMTHVEQSVERIKEKYGCISLVIIDTWARNMVGDENSTQDTGNAIRSLDALRLKNDCTALIIHHSGQAESDRARGSSALRAALDVEYKVSISDEIVTLTNTKMKDGEPPDPLMFCFDHIDLGVEDEDGEIIFSAALEPLDVNDIVPQNAKLGETQALIYDELYKKVDGMTKADIVHLVESTGKKRNAAYKAMTELSKKGKIKLENGIVLACIPVCIPGIHVSGIQG
jgi:hypothetical protein